MSIQTKINGKVVTETPNQTVAKIKEVSIGELVDAIETVVNASKVMGAGVISNILTTKLYSSHDAEYLETLVKAGEYAKHALQKDIWLEARKDTIVSFK
jgi:hypothetical protein